jgi:hypothetical protein
MWSDTGHLLSSSSFGFGTYLACQDLTAPAGLLAPPAIAAAPAGVEA